MDKTILPTNCIKKEFEALTKCKVSFRDKNKECVSFKLIRGPLFLKVGWDNVQKYFEESFANVKVWRSFDEFGFDVFLVRVYPEAI